jgi:hypothetical protein
MRIPAGSLRAAVLAGFYRIEWVIVMPRVLVAVAIGHPQMGLMSLQQLPG